MLRILIKKQFAELLAGISTNRRTGKKRSAGALVGYSLLLAFAAVSIMFAFGTLYLVLGMTMKNGDPQSGRQAFEGWGGIYFAFTGIITAMIGLIGGMFSTYTVLYCPKDNEMLLSMPIKPMYILAARMMSVYILIVAYTFTSFLPALVIYWILDGFSFLVFLRALVMYIALTMLVLAVSCLLGWLLALLAAKLGGKRIVTVVSLLVSAGAYYLFYFQRQRIMDAITADPAKAELTFKTKLYPFYAYGKGTADDWISFLIFFAICAAAMGLTLFILSRTFISLVTTKKSGKKKVYVEKKASANSPLGALTRREIRRFLTNPLYLINNGLGAIIMIVLSVIALVNTRGIRNLLSSGGLPGEGAFVVLAAIGAIGLVLAMTPVSSSSVSLEGSRIWVLQTIPATAETILFAKMAVHTIFAGIPAVILAVSLGIVLDAGISTAVLAAAALAFAILIGSFGLMLEVHNPKLVWTDENMAVKQNLNVLFAMLGGFGAAVFFAIVSIPVCIFVPAMTIPMLAFQFFACTGLSILFFRMAVNFWPCLCV